MRGAVPEKVLSLYAPARAYDEKAPYPVFGRGARGCAVRRRSDPPRRAHQRQRFVEQFGDLHLPGLLAAHVVRHVGRAERLQRLGVPHLQVRTRQSEHDLEQRDPQHRRRGGGYRLGGHRLRHQPHRHAPRPHRPLLSGVRTERSGRGAGLLCRGLSGRGGLLCRYGVGDRPLRRPDAASGGVQHPAFQLLGNTRRLCARAEHAAAAYGPRPAGADALRPPGGGRSGGAGDGGAVPRRERRGAVRMPPDDLCGDGGFDDFRLRPPDGRGLRAGGGSSALEGRRVRRGRAARRAAGVRVRSLGRAVLRPRDAAVCRRAGACGRQCPVAAQRKPADPVGRDRRAGRSGTVRGRHRVQQDRQPADIRRQEQSGPGVFRGRPRRHVCRHEGQRHLCPAGRRFAGRGVRPFERAGQPVRLCAGRGVRERHADRARRRGNRRARLLDGVHFADRTAGGDPLRIGLCDPARSGERDALARDERLRAGRPAARPLRRRPLHDPRAAHLRQ